MNEARLYEILKLKRGDGSVGEQMMIDRQIMPYNPQIFTDPAGRHLAYYIQVGVGGKSVFCAHTDTVHGRASVQTIRPVRDDEHVNNIDHDVEGMMVHARGDVLGADDGAGIWLLMEMIDAGVVGSYLFHRSEEVGGIGSSGMAAHHGDFLKQFDHAIAFDRKGVHSIITHQSYSRGCSDEFADALGEALSCDTYFFAKDDGGVFTDTANYIDHIGETTNISVGYYSEHTHNEKLDLHYLFNLRKQCINITWAGIPVKRTPGERELLDRGYWVNPWPAPSKREVIGNVDLFDLEFEDIVDLFEDDPYVGASAVWELMWGSDLDSSDESFATRLKLGLV